MEEEKSEIPAQKESFLKVKLAKMKAKSADLKKSYEEKALELKERAVSVKNKAVILVGKPKAACSAALAEAKTMIKHLKPTAKKEVLCITYGSRDLAIMGYMKFSLHFLFGYYYVTDAEYVIYEAGKPVEVLGEEIGSIKIKRSAVKMVI